VPDYREGLDAGVRGLRVGIPREQFYGLLDAEVRIAVEEAIQVFRSLGAEVLDIDPGFTREQTAIAWQVVNAEGQVHHKPYFGPHPEMYSDDLRGVLTLQLPDALGLTEAYRASYDVKEGVRRAFEQVDVMLAPTTMRPAAKIGEEQVDVEGIKLTPGAAFAGLTLPFNIAGVPSISVPCGFSSAGLPIGMQIAGGPFQEATLLRAARAYEAATDWHTRRADC
jgi:aspartyl-tRNA(Asn)/glutamyl-tRNA(Gln) amidotransferase subunit A